MLIPATYFTALLLIILSAVCWGCWAITKKITGPKWRYELYYMDFSVGLFVGVLGICLTFGSFNGADITFIDSMIGISLRKISWAMVAGLVFNIANVMLVSSVSTAGMAMAFPIVMSISTVVGLLLNYALTSQSYTAMTWAGIVTLLAAVVFNARAYRMMTDIRRSQLVTTDPSAAPPSQISARSSRVRKSGKTKSSSIRGVLISILAGFIMGFAMPLLDLSREGDLAISPYAAMFFFAGGIMFTSLLIVPFMMAFPVEGEPLEVGRLFSGGVGSHLVGIVGGVIAAGWIAMRLLAFAVPRGQQVGSAIALAAELGGPLLAAVIGLVVYKEFADTGARVRMQVTVMMVLLGLALALTAMAPLFS